jgi:ATP-dependent RNA helicase DDX21
MALVAQNKIFLLCLQMLNMGFAEDVEKILRDVGSKNEKKTQCLLFSATTPSWVKSIGRQYQENALAIDSTGDDGGARVANTVRHTAVQMPFGQDSKLAILEDIIAVEISKDKSDSGSENEEEELNLIAAQARANKKKGNNAMQQSIFGKTIAQALHGDVGQKQRDATLNAFRQGSFNVLVATDVAARGIDIKDVDLVVQMDPPRDVDTYVHRSGRTGRAGQKGVSVLLFNKGQARDIVKIERDLGHDFKFELVGPPSAEAALRAAAKTSAIACKGIPDETARYFNESAAALLAEYDNPQDVVARCLAAISRRSSDIQSRSMITGELGVVTVEMKNSRKNIAANDVMFTVSKLSRLSQEEGDDSSFASDIGKIQTNAESGTAFFDMSIEDAKKLVKFSQGIDAGGSEFSLVTEMEIERDRFFGMNDRNGRRGVSGGRGGGGRFNNREGGSSRGRYNGGEQRRSSFGGDHSHTGRSNRVFEGRPGPRESNGYTSGGGSGGQRYGGGGAGGGNRGAGASQGSYRGRYDSNRPSISSGGGW